MENDPQLISYGARISKAALQSQYASVMVPAPGSPSHGCRIVLPKSAARASNVEPQPIKKGALAVIAGFQVTPAVLVQISGTIIEFEINLADWLKFELQSRGIELDLVSSKIDPNGQVVHGNTTGPTGFRGRVVARNNGPNILLLASQMPENAEAGVIETIGLAAASLDLTAPLHRQLMEPLAPAQDQKPSFRFQYPKSWTIKQADAASPSISALEIKITSQTDTVAYLRAHYDSNVISGESKIGIMKDRLIKQLTEAGVAVGEMAPLAPLAEKPAMSRFAGPARMPNGEGMAAVAVQPVATGWLGVILISPGRKMNPLAWLRAKRCFEIVTATLAVI